MGTRLAPVVGPTAFDFLVAGLQRSDRIPVGIPAGTGSKGRWGGHLSLLNFTSNPKYYKPLSTGF